MLRIRENLQLRPWLEFIDPGDSFFDSHKLILVALNDQPGTVRLRVQMVREPSHGRCNADQTGRCGRHCGTNGHRRAERESRNPEGDVGILRSGPGDGRKNILEFTLTIVKGACTLADAAKIESQHCETQTQETAGKRMYNLVLQGAAVDRVRVADNHASGENSIRGDFKQRLEVTSWPVDKKLMLFGVFSHRKCLACPYVIAVKLWSYKDCLRHSTDLLYWEVNSMSSAKEVENQYCAHNYHPLPVVLTRGEGVYVWDENGKKYLDMMSAYSAVSHGHANPRLVAALKAQAERLSIVSRAFYTDKLGPFLERACQLTGQDMALPMNTGAEAVETAVKAARRWGYEAKGIAHDQAEIIVCTGNFHGRTTTIISFSDETEYQKNFGPLTPGFKIVQFGDADALEKAITPNTAAFLVEPIQGEGGIVIPPKGYLKACRDICTRHNVLLIADEIQTGLGRTGKLLACDHEEVVPDGLILGKALGGGIMPVSMFLAKKEVMDIFVPGTHGSTFGGNPLAAAVGLEALNILVEEKLPERSMEMGSYLMSKLRQLDSPLISELRGSGLFVGIEIDPAVGSAREICERLMDRGLLSKETHETVVRLAPPLVITREEIDWAVQQIREVLQEMDGVRLAS